MYIYIFNVAFCAFVECPWIFVNNVRLLLARMFIIHECYPFLFGFYQSLKKNITLCFFHSFTHTHPPWFAVAALKMNETLQELFLADNRLMPSDGIQLGNLLKYNHSLTLLDLRNNHLQVVLQLLHYIFIYFPYFCYAISFIDSLCLQTKSL